MDIFSIDLIKINYFALDKKSCIQEMAEFLFKKGVITSLDAFLEAIFERENLMSTGIGRGVAIPHARSSVVTKLKIALYTLENELEYNSIDGEPVKIIFMIAVPESMKQEYMKVLSLISNFCKEEENRKKLIHSKSEKEAMEILQQRIENEI
jgi:fructose-specific phosphotransferase system IIA component